MFLINIIGRIIIWKIFCQRLYIVQFKPDIRCIKQSNLNKQKSENRFSFVLHRDFAAKFILQQLSIICLVNSAMLAKFYFEDNRTYLTELLSHLKVLRRKFISQLKPL